MGDTVPSSSSLVEETSDCDSENDFIERTLDCSEDIVISSSGDSDDSFYVTRQKKKLVLSDEDNYGNSSYKSSSCTEHIGYDANDVPTNNGIDCNSHSETLPYDENSENDALNVLQCGSQIVSNENQHDTLNTTFVSTASNELSDREDFKNSNYSYRSKYKKRTSLTTSARSDSYEEAVDDDCNKNREDNKTSFENTDNHKFIPKSKSGRCDFKNRLSDIDLKTECSEVETETLADALNISDETENKAEIKSNTEADENYYNGGCLDNETNTEKHKSTHISKYESFTYKNRSSSIIDLTEDCNEAEAKNIAGPLNSSDGDSNLSARRSRKLLHPDDNCFLDLTEQLQNIDISKNADGSIEILNEESEQLLAEKNRLELEIKNVQLSIKNKTVTFKTIDLNILPDKGMKLKVSLARDQRSLETLNEQYTRVCNKYKSLLQDIKVDKGNINKNAVFNFADLPSASVQDMGVRALQTHQVQQSLTVHSLKQLHNSVNSCPTEENFVDDPPNLKLPLMLHQKQALAWLMWREKEKPSGGILADDMGLGKTLTMISLILKQCGSDEETSDSSSDDEYSSEKKRKYYKGGTLIVCPSSLIGQWESEIKQKVKQGALSYQIFHGSNREKKARRLAKLDIVITSYSIVRVESERAEEPAEHFRKEGVNNSVLYAIKWQRVILDEAHNIRNYKSKTSIAVCCLRAKNRWALTGTPIHNKTQDFFALIKFLRCKPFDEISVWKKWIEAKDETGVRRMNMLTKSLMLRRTKALLMSEGKLGVLPDRSSEDIYIKLCNDELLLYEEVANFSKTLLTQLLYQKAEKENLVSQGVSIYKNKTPLFNENDNPFVGHPALQRLFNRVHNTQTVSTHVILVLLLRLRQICCHPALMKSMVEKEAFVQDGINDEDGNDIELLEKMSSMSVNDNIDHSCESDNSTGKSKVLDINNPIFKADWTSSKVHAILQLLNDRLLDTNDKIIIVSQWTSMLELLWEFLKTKRNCKCDCLSGKVPVQQRMQIVNDFNNESSKTKILLLSLTAGGTGLNLIGGNHLILTDLHWNPQLEAQACDRIYRVGQKKPVRIYKLICSETIEERILQLQQDKLEMANDVLTGVKRVEASKLTLNDLKMLFNIS